jgi:hypothetical protein
MAKVMDAATANSLAIEALSERAAIVMEANYKQEEENLTESLLMEIYDNIENAAKEGKFRTSHIIYDEVSFIDDYRVKLSLGLIVANIINILRRKGFHVDYHIQYSREIGCDHDYHLTIDW